MDKIITTELYDLIRHIHTPGTDVVLYITSRNFDSDAAGICDKLSREVNFYELRVDNWDDNLTPWAADAKMKGRTFGGNAADLLSAVLREIIPEVKEGDSRIFIAGYSLAGLFSLWALYESDVFSGCACCSGSLWYPGWAEYAGTHKIHLPSKVYLSVGDREKNSKNEYMKKVEEAYKIQRELLGTDAYFELNEGGHFRDVNARVVKGINRLLSN